MNIEISYSNDGSTVTEEDIRLGDNCIPNQVEHFWKRYMPCKRRKAPDSGTLPAEFADDARDVVASSLSGDGVYAKGEARGGRDFYRAFDREHKVGDGGLYLIRRAVQSLTSSVAEGIISGLDSSPGKNILRPTLLREEVPQNPFGNMSNGPEYLCGAMSVDISKDREITSPVEDLMRRFAAFVKTSPQAISGTSTLEIFGGTFGDVASVVASSKARVFRAHSNPAHGICAVRDEGEVDRLEEAAPQPLKDMGHLSYYCSRPRAGSSETLYFGGMHRRDLTNDLIAGAEFGFETFKSRHYLTLRPVYDYKTAWNIDRYGKEVKV